MILVIFKKTLSCGGAKLGLFKKMDFVLCYKYFAKCANMSYQYASHI